MVRDGPHTLFKYYTIFNYIAMHTIIGDMNGVSG